MQSRMDNPATVVDRAVMEHPTSREATTAPADSLVLTKRAMARASAVRTIAGTALGVTAALVTTTTVFVVGNLGAPIRVATGWSPDGANLSWTEVAITAATAVALGGLLLWCMERRWANSFSVWARIAIAVAIVSALPLLRLDIDAGSKVSLVLMHLLTGVCAAGAHRAVRIHLAVRS